MSQEHQESALQAQDTSKEHLEPVRRPKVLLVDDSAGVLESLTMVLKHHDFDVVTASNVREAIKQIGSQPFDILLSDLHMPLAGDGLTVVSAMRHHHPHAVTIIFSGYPEMQEAAAAILMQTDEILVKPMDVDKLVETIRDRLKRGPSKTRAVQSIASILEQDTQLTIADWMHRVKSEPHVISVSLSEADRCAHLPQLFRDLVARLSTPMPLGSRALVSPAATKHGLIRRKQGYTAAMMVEESRMLQVSLFQTLQSNLSRVDFSVLLLSVMAIADEVDSQLAQAMASYIAESEVDGGPGESTDGTTGSPSDGLSAPEHARPSP